MKLIISNDSKDVAPDVIIVDHFAMLDIVHYLRGEGIKIPEPKKVKADEYTSQEDFDKYGPDTLEESYL